MIKKLKFWGTEVEESQGCVPMWSKFTPEGRYEESEEFKLVTWETTYRTLFGVVLWPLSSWAKEESQWYTTDTFYEEIYGTKREI